MNDDSLPVRAVSLPPPPALQRVSLPPDYQRAQELMRAALEAAIPVAKLAGAVPTARGVSIASPVLVAMPVPFSRPALNAKTEPIVRATPLVAPVAVAIAMPVSRPAPNAVTEPIALPVQMAEPVAVAVAVAVATPLAGSQPALMAKSAPAIEVNLRKPKVAMEPSKPPAEPTSLLW